MPTTVSCLIRDRCSLAYALWWRSAAPRAGAALSSTSCDACQKNRYGLIVVPSTATTIAA